MSSFHRISLSFLVLCVMLISPAVSQSSCLSETFSGDKSYPHCLDLPTLNATLHYSYDASNTTLAIVFSAPPSKSGGWIAWAINPNSTGMAGSQALVALKDPKTGVASVMTFNIMSYSTLLPNKLLFEVWDVKAEEAAGYLRIFAKIKVPANLAANGKVNQVWQVGPGVSPSGKIKTHDFKSQNLNAMGSLDLTSNSTNVHVTRVGNGNSRAHKGKIHGILNAVSWGILFPIGAMIVRYMKIVQTASPVWLYLHILCQISAYIIGTAGWATGLKLGSESKGIQFNSHRNIGTALFVMATIQILTAMVRPKKEYKYRYLWDIYHRGVGYSILILGMINVFKGLSMLKPNHPYKTAYIVVIATLGGITLLLEVVTWIIVIKRKSEKPPPPRPNL